MKKLWSERVRDLTPYVPGEQPKGGLIKLNTNENPYPPSPKIEKAILEATARLRLYPDPESVSLCSAIANRHKVSRDMVFVGNGSDEVLALAFMAFFAGRGVIFPDITYSFYSVYSNLFDIHYKKVPLKQNFEIDAAAMKGEGAGVIFANPNAPTSLFLELDAVADIAKANSGAVVIVDEAYVEFGGRSAIELIEKHTNIVVVRTLSKSHALAGLRLGYAIAAPGLIEALIKVKNSFNSYPLDMLAQAAGEAAIKDEKYYGEIINKIIGTRERLTASLREMGFAMPEPKANFVFASKEGVDASRLFAALRRSGILVRHFEGERTFRHLRITVGTEEQTDKLLAAINAELG
ncbi:MAG: histidinol-phosphate transaminase [Christensenellales bacterium]